MTLDAVRGLLAEKQKSGHFSLRWTKETPNVAGKMYLAKGLDLIVYVLKIIEVNGVLYAQFPDGKECRMSYFFEWAGPIPAPLEE